MLKKLPVGILIFLGFAITGVGTAEVIHQKSLGKTQSSEQESQEVESVDEQPTLNNSHTVTNTQTVSSVSKNKSRESESKIKQSSKERDGEDGDDDEDEEGDDDDSFVNSTSSQTTLTPTPVSTSTSTTAKTFTMAQVSTHNSSASCYTTISGSVYDLTSWIGQHPGGSSAIESLCGIDGTSAFSQQHSGQARPANELAGFKIGVLVQ